MCMGARYGVGQRQDRPQERQSRLKERALLPETAICSDVLSVTCFPMQSSILPITTYRSLFQLPYSAETSPLNSRLVACFRTILIAADGLPVPVMSPVTDVIVGINHQFFGGEQYLHLIHACKLAHGIFYLARTGGAVHAADFPAIAGAGDVFRERWRAGNAEYERWCRHTL